MEAMLAKEYRKGMKTPTSDKECKPPIGWYASEKYDGYRALFDSSSRTLLSRAQKQFISPQWFIDMLPDNDLDGELWVGRENFEQMGVVRRKEPEDEDWLPIKYVVYDIPSLDVPFKERLTQLKKIVKQVEKRWNTLREELCEPLCDIECPLVFAKQTLIKSHNHLETMYKELLQKGSEGIMMKCPKSFYEGKRSNYMLKYKPSFDEEAIIIGHKMGNGKYEGMLGAFICQQLINHDTYHETDMNENHNFSISGMDDSIRDDFEVSHPIGTIISYEHSGRTTTGKPRFPRYLRIREDITIQEVLLSKTVTQRDKIICILRDISVHEKMNGKGFQANAYQKVITALQKITDDSLLTEQTIRSIKGVGDSIYTKIAQIQETGTCPLYDTIQAIVNPQKIFLDIHGVGPKCAKKLVDQGYKTIQELRDVEPNKLKTLLNSKQLLGLQYYEPLLERIPFSEVENHEKFLTMILRVIDPNAELTIAGSYRRRCETSGDIDVLLKTDDNTTYKRFIQKLRSVGYLQEDLAKGAKKYNGICKMGIKGTSRRIDIMKTSPEEYPFAILYFTGSDEFNKKMRQYALSIGYSINEYSITFKNDDNEEVSVHKVFNNEKDIFMFLEYEYVEPWERY
jgi:DNA ligase 1